MKIEPRTLQQRTLIFILLPTFLLLVILLLVGFVFVRDILINQWGEAAVSKLQRSAHLIDMRLREPKKLLQLLQDGEDSDVDRQLVSYIVQRIEQLDGVVEVNIEWPPQYLEQNIVTAPGSSDGSGKNSHLQSKRLVVSFPKYDSRFQPGQYSLQVLQ